MYRLLRRTSITVDEAVAILLGHASRPIETEPFDESEEAEANCPVFGLEILEDECDVLEGEYDLAKYEKQPAHVVAEKLEALKRQEVILDQANDHLCEINDELNKGEQSVLKVDRELSTAAYTYITRHSFSEWVKRRRQSACEQHGGAEAVDSDRVPAKKEKKQRDKGIRQQDAILAALREKKCKLLALPPNRIGRAGVRSEIYEALRDSPLFGTRKIYETAWKRCFDLNLLAYEAAPTPLQKED